MPRDENGSYTLPPGSWTGAKKGEVATVEDWNDLAKDIEKTLNNALDITENKQVIKANIDLGNNTFLNAAPAIKYNQFVTAGQLLDQVSSYLEVTRIEEKETERASVIHTKFYNDEFLKYQIRLNQVLILRLDESVFNISERNGEHLSVNIPVIGEMFLYMNDGTRCRKMDLPHHSFVQIVWKEKGKLYLLSYENKIPSINDNKLIGFFKDYTIDFTGSELYLRTFHFLEDGLGSKYKKFSNFSKTEIILSDIGEGWKECYLIEFAGKHKYLLCDPQNANEYVVKEMEAAWEEGTVNLPYAAYMATVFVTENGIAETFIKNDNCILNGNDKMFYRFLVANVIKKSKIESNLFENFVSKNIVSVVIRIDLECSHVMSFDDWGKEQHAIVNAHVTQRKGAAPYEGMVLSCLSSNNGLVKRQSTTMEIYEMDGKIPFSCWVSANDGTKKPIFKHKDNGLSVRIVSYKVRKDVFNYYKKNVE